MLRLKWTKRGPERHTEAEGRENVRGVIPEQELHQDRRAAEEPDVDPGAPGDDRVGGQAHDGQDDAYGYAPSHGQDRERQA